MLTKSGWKDTSAPKEEQKAAKQPQKPKKAKEKEKPKLQERRAWDMSSADSLEEDFAKRETVAHSPTKPEQV
jgi:hypothetical protein